MRSEVSRALDRASAVAFLCSGNIIRSAFAELYGRHLNGPYQLRSAATTYDSDWPYEPTRQALLKRGVSPKLIHDFKPTPLGKLLPQLDDRAVLFGMKHEHIECLPPVPNLRRRSFLLSELLGRNEEIADPMFEGGFEPVIKSIAHAVEALIQYGRRASGH